MARRALLLAVAVAALAVAATSSAVDGRAGDVGWIGRGKNCHGTVGECLGDADDELQAGGGGGASRRLVGVAVYISYLALRASAVPCTVRGLSYYNCRPGAVANPYTRGCSAITRCRG